MVDAFSGGNGNAEVGHALTRQRSQAGLSVEQLARRAQLPPSHVLAIEEGRQSPYLTDLVQLARALGMRPSTLFAELHVDAGAPVDRR